MAMTKKEYAQKSREELYKNVKDFVFGFFENDSHVPAWEKPYRRVLSYNWLTSPKNEIKPYTFFNQCLLNDCGCFATFNQIMNLNSKTDVESFLKTKNKDFLNINPFGHKAQRVVFMIRMEVPDKDLFGTPEYDKVKEAIKNKEKNPETYKQYFDKGMITLTPPHIEFFNVFNINDINNLPKSVYDEQMKRFENFNKMYCEKDIDKTLEEKGDLFIKAYLDAHPDITLLHSGINSPNYAYVPSIDEETKHTYRSLHLPYKEGCVNLSSYYSIAAHEISHSTMVNDKERAKESKSRRKEAYAKEELIAELSACMIISYLGLGSEYSKNNSREYCSSWKTVIKDLKESDVTYCFMQSQKAANEVIDTYEKALTLEKTQVKIKEKESRKEINKEPKSEENEETKKKSKKKQLAL